MNNEVNKRIANLTPAQRALFEQRLKQKRAAVKQQKTITKRVNREEFPLSFAQERMWFLQQLEPENATYNRPINIKLTGKLNVTVLELSLNEILRRHEVLRSKYTVVDGLPILVIDTQINLKLSIINLRSSNQQKTELEKLVKKEAQQPFNLANGNLLRATLVQLTEEQQILLLTTHHIVFDGWSAGVLIEELGKLYQAFSQNLPSPLPNLTIQYADFAQWQKEQLKQEKIQAQLTYWQKKLTGQLPILELPTDRIRKPVQTFQGAKYCLTLSPSLSKSLKDLSKQQGVTLFMTLLAAFATLLYRYTGEEDIILGCPIAGRSRLEIEKLIGVFINTLVLRIQLNSNLTFKQLLTQVSQVAKEAYENQDIPFEKLVEELNPERSLSHNPIFQVLFQLRNLPVSTVKLDDLTIEEVKFDRGIAALDLSLDIVEKPSELVCYFEYNTDLFDAVTIERMAGHFQVLLAGIINQPDEKISLLPLLLLTAKEKQQLLIDWSNPRNQIISQITFTEFTKEEIEQSIPARFAQQVQKYPEKIAIKSKKYCWSYEELNKWVKAIAYQINQLQSTHETTRIGLLFEHDAPAIAAILGVLTAGKTYVALDASYPQARLNYILEDAQATVIITNNNNYNLAVELTQENIPIINFDEIELNSNLQNNPSIAPDSIAYILYTSGSTGKPKGVVQNHRNVLHFIRNYTNNLHLNSNDKLTLISSINFDAAIMDIFGALLNGATLYPCDVKNESMSSLLEWLIREKITIYHSTPTVYRYLMKTLATTNLSQLNNMRLVVLGGEKIVKKDVELYQKYLPELCILTNIFGQTESSFNLQYLLNQKTKNIGENIPIGYPVENTEILLLNEAGKNNEVYGEIAIKSYYVALEYWQKPALTQAKFILAENNQRIYRTGDIGRLKADGSILFLGRKDDQVKIRGFRIELGEIEANLNQHPDIKETVVIARENEQGEKYLSAYLITKKPIKIKEIRQFLSEKLPDYMIPSAFVFLDAFPLTPNGKIDRKALPEPDLEANREHEFIAPRNDTEIKLAQI